jgi:hypothetical protein
VASATSTPADCFVWQPGDLILSQCVSCRHKHAGGATCDAFPQGVPDAILRNQHDHCQPYPNDRGVRWVPQPGAGSPDRRPMR